MSFFESSPKRPISFFYSTLISLRQLCAGLKHFATKVECAKQPTDMLWIGRLLLASVVHLNVLYPPPIFVRDTGPKKKHTTVIKQARRKLNTSSLLFRGRHRNFYEQRRISHRVDRFSHPAHWSENCIGSSAGPLPLAISRNQMNEIGFQCFVERKPNFDARAEVRFDIRVSLHFCLDFLF